MGMVVAHDGSEEALVPEDPRQGESTPAVPSNGDDDARRPGDEHRQDPPSPAPADELDAEASSGTGSESSAEPGRDAVPGGTPPHGTPFAAIPSLTEHDRDVLARLWFTSVDELVAACATPEGALSVAETLDLDAEAFQSLMDEARAVLGEARFDALLEPAPEHPFGYRLDEPDSPSTADAGATDGHGVDAAEGGETGDGQTDASDPDSRAEDGRWGT